MKRNTNVVELSGEHFDFIYQKIDMHMRAAAKEVHSRLSGDVPFPVFMHLMLTYVLEEILIAAPDKESADEFLEDCRQGIDAVYPHILREKDRRNAPKIDDRG